MEKGDILAYIHTNKEEEIDKAKLNINMAYEISEEEPEKYIEILDII